MLLTTSSRSPSPVAKQWAGARSGKVATGFPSIARQILDFDHVYQVRSFRSDLIVIYVPDRADEGSSETVTRLKQEPSPGLRPPSPASAYAPALGAQKGPLDLFDGFAVAPRPILRTGEGDSLER